MRSEELYGLASAHGVDLVAAARMGSNPALRETVTRTKRGIQSTVLLQPPKNRAAGTQNRPAVRPQWTIAELGQAAQGVPDIPFQAALYAWAGDKTHYWRLHQALYREAFAMAKQKGWPVRIRDLHGIDVAYLAHLAALLLDWEANQHVFHQSPEMYAIFMRVSPGTWEKRLQGPFEELNRVWLDWLGTAARIMQPQLSELEDSAESPLGDAR